MGIRVIPLSELAEDLERTLSECATSGDALVVELPGHRLVSIQGLEPPEDDSLIDELLVSDAAFREMLRRSKESPRKPFPGKTDA